MVHECAFLDYLMFSKKYLNIWILMYFLPFFSSSVVRTWMAWRQLGWSSRFSAGKLCGIHQLNTSIRHLWISFLLEKILLKNVFFPCDINCNVYFVCHKKKYYYIDFLYDIQQNKLKHPLCTSYTLLFERTK